MCVLMGLLILQKYLAQEALTFHRLVIHGSATACRAQLVATALPDPPTRTAYVLQGTIALSAPQTIKFIRALAARTLVIALDSRTLCSATTAQSGISVRWVLSTLWPAPPARSIQT